MICRDLLLYPEIVRALRLIAGDARTARLIRSQFPALNSLFDTNWYRESYSDIEAIDPLIHYLALGASERRQPHPLFDTAYYISRHAAAASSPLTHYLRQGVMQRHATHPERGFCLLPPLVRPLRLLTLLVRHGTERYPDADRRLDALLSRTLPDVERSTVIIDNALPSGLKSACGSQCFLIGGDNTDWEFSGWNVGLRFAGGLARPFDLIHFATDAFEQFDAAAPARITAPMLEALRFGPAAAGHIDFFNEPAELFGQPVQFWLRSSFFFLRPAEVRALGSMVSLLDKRAVFSGDPGQPFRKGSSVSGRLADYLTGWLTGEGTGQGVQWHSRFVLNAGTLPFFEAKAAAILNELLLSQRLLSAGCWLADISWLVPALGGSVTGRLFEERWDSQIRNRP